MDRAFSIFISPSSGDIGARTGTKNVIDKKYNDDEGVKPSHYTRNKSCDNEIIQKMVQFFLNSLFP